jgi:hypothetical protein
MPGFELGHASNLGASRPASAQQQADTTNHGASMCREFHVFFTEAALYGI